jgi:hypothetical protein
MPANTIFSTLTTPPIRLANGDLDTRPDYRDGVAPGGGGGTTPVDPAGVIFSENFDAQPDYTATLNSIDKLQSTAAGYNIPNNWDIVYQSSDWTPEQGFANSHAPFEILAADSSEARGGTGKAMRHYRESAKTSTISDFDGDVVLGAEISHIRIWQSTSPSFNTTKTSVATVNGVTYSFSTTTGADGASFDATSYSLNDKEIGSVGGQFASLTNQRPRRAVFSNAIAVPSGATVSITNADIQGYDSSSNNPQWDEWSKKWNSDSQLIKFPIDINNPDGTEELYVEFRIKFSANWYQRGFYEDGWASKLFRVAHVTPGGNAISGFGGDMGPIFVWDYKSDNFGVRNVHTFRGGPPGNTISGNNYKTDELFGRFNGSRNFTSSIAGMEVGGADPQLPDLVNGGLTVNQPGNIYHESVFGPPEKWTKVAFYVKMNSGPGVEDGVFSQYIDGHRIIHYPNCAWMGPNVEDLRVKWNQISIGGNDNLHPYPASDLFEDWYAIDDLFVRDSLPEVFI